MEGEKSIFVPSVMSRGRGMKHLGVSTVDLQAICYHCAKKMWSRERRGKERRGGERGLRNRYFGICPSLLPISMING